MPQRSQALPDGVTAVDGRPIRRDEAAPGRPQKGTTAMSDAAARALAADGLPATREDAEAWYADWLWSQVEGRRDAAARKAADKAGDRALLKGGIEDLKAIKHASNTGAPTLLAFKAWLRTGQNLPPPGFEHKALVEDGLGRILVPADLVLDVLREVELRSAFRELATIRPTNSDRQQQGLLGAASAGWSKLETGGVATDANVVPESPVLEIEVHDAVALAKVGTDELDDALAGLRVALVEAIADAILVLEDTAFAVGTGSGQPKGLALAANVARVAAGQKTAAGASATPTIADLATVVGKLPYRYRRRAVWLFSEDAFAAVLKLQWSNGDALMPRAGEGIGPFGWPYRVAPLPAMSTAGVTDPSVWFTDLGAAFRIVDRAGLSVQRLVQRYQLEGLVGFLVRKRVGSDMVRPEACSIYLL